MSSKLAPVVLAALLAACAQTKERPQTASARPVRPAAPKVPLPWTTDPFPSTYRAYPGVPTLVTNVTIFDGEGGRIEGGSVLIADGKVVQLGAQVAAPQGVTVIDGRGKWVTPGVIDIHSHLGNGASPGVQANNDVNEAVAPNTANVWAEHGVNPQDPGFSRALVNGGVTTLQILPGSANLFGGRSVVLKNVYARTTQGMKFPGAPYGLKMACGENPKRVYGAQRREPATRMGNIAVDRQTWIRAADYRRRWEKYERDGGDPPQRDLGYDTLAGVLTGGIRVQNHCYRADEMANVIDMSKEFGYKVNTFHHAVEAYKVADLLRANGICAAVWADWYGFKMESYDGIRENLALVDAGGGCGMIHSDDQNGIQRLNQEVAKVIAAARRMGMTVTPERAWTWLSWNPAKALGIADRTGSLRPGKMADMVLWNGDPFSVYTRPEKVWVDGALMFDALDPRRRPVADFELGQPGEGDVK